LIELRAERSSPSGTTRVRFNNVGVLKGEHEFRLGRHNILVGPNEAGKTTVAEIISAFSGGVHWNWFNERFGFSKLPPLARI
jgi:ABC-type molybdenum transport system ATPase subunit/photorepair protein PhrA